MTGAELVAEFRELSQDRIEPYLWTSDWILAKLNEAEREACDRARLIYEDSEPRYCDVPFAAGQHVSTDLHPKVIDVVRAFLDGRAIPLHDVTELDWRSGTNRRCFRGGNWRDGNSGPAGLVIDGKRRLLLTPTPKDDCILQLEVYRLPAQDFGLDDEPEIDPIHHKELVHWALYRAFWIPDPDEKNENRAAYYYSLFEQYFGRKVDANKRRRQHANRPHINKLW